MIENRFYICRHCGNIIEVVKNAGVPVVCCGEKMEALTPNTVEASHEKHLPVVTLSGKNIKASVGSDVHPMTEQHSIEWIYLETSKGGQLKRLMPNEAPEAEFALTDEQPYAVYAYCNLHGLWKTEIK